ncbi:unnamed protein product [Aureobasidium mustum]|uniref:Uncharacterized protein n=1 Tax=Aureobasidium mustum TaxID=2773714 RepID=A0A9N8K4F7_9PEZI|nr:unnamed protein product [Aureobasidium mustum]
MRSQGDADEVAVYRALGAFRHVGKIHLTVYCPPPFPASFQSSDELENQHASDQVPDGETKAAMDHALINAAIDENLARSIYRTVSTSRAEFSYPLEHLSLRVGKTYKTTQFTWKLAYIGRSWTCVRNDRDDRLHECSICEYDIREKLDREYKEDENSFFKIDNSTILEAVCRVWPAARNMDWKRAWHSFPLADSR